jgi:hypothetical protein
MMHWPPTGKPERRARVVTDVLWDRLAVEASLILNFQFRAAAGRSLVQRPKLRRFHSTKYPVHPLARRRGITLSAEEKGRAQKFIPAGKLLIADGLGWKLNFLFNVFLKAVALHYRFNRSHCA